MTDRASIARRALVLLDLTDLSDSCSVAEVETLCGRAVTPHGAVAAICVWPRFVSTAKAALGPSKVRIATVVNFPSGDEGIDEVVRETRRAIDDGADEIDVVLPYRSMLAGDEERARSMLTAVRHAAPAPVLVKVILETGELPDSATIANCARLAIACGADFIKTSTGKTAVSATTAAVDVMLDVIAHSGGRVGIKPSGGIRTLDDAATYLASADRIMGTQWVDASTFRFGASGLLDAILKELS